MNENLQALLGHLCKVLEEKRQSDTEQLHRRALNWERVERLPVVMSYPVCEDFPFQPYPHSAIFNDPEKMLFNELVHAFNTSVSLRRELNDDLPCTVRANFGTVIIASMFGAHIQQVGENPPWVVAADSREISLEAIADHNPSDLSGGWFPRVVETYEAYRNVLSLWPEFRRTIYTVLPVMRAMRGGGVHSCGNIGTHAEAFLELDGIGCLDLGQPEMNDIDRIYALARVKRIPLLRISVPEEDLVTGKVLDRFPTGVTLLHGARSPNDADRIMTAYCREAENRRKRPMAEQPVPPIQLESGRRLV